MSDRSQFLQDGWVVVNAYELHMDVCYQLRSSGQTTYRQSVFCGKNLTLDITR